MSDINVLSEESIKTFVAAWYVGLDIHAPYEDMCSFLADTGLVMDFPDGKISDLASFKVWYDRVTHIFFDENHYVQSVSFQTPVSDGATEAVLDIIVGWQASWFEAPQPKSKRTSMNATQRWTVRPSSKNKYGLEIAAYNATVKPFEFAPGFATF